MLAGARGLRILAQQRCLSSREASATKMRDDAERKTSEEAEEDIRQFQNKYDSQLDFDFLSRVTISRQRRQVHAQKVALKKLFLSNSTPHDLKRSLVDPYDFHNSTGLARTLNFLLPTGLRLTFLGNRTRGGENGQKPSLSSVLISSNQGNFLWCAGPTTLDCLEGENGFLQSNQISPTDIDAIFLPDLSEIFCGDLPNLVRSIEEANNVEEEANRIYKRIAVFGPPTTADLINKGRNPFSPRFWFSPVNQELNRLSASKDSSLFRRQAQRGFIQEVVMHRKFSFQMPLLNLQNEWSVQIVPLSKDSALLGYIFQEPATRRICPKEASELLKQDLSHWELVEAYNKLGRVSPGRKIVMVGPKPPESSVNRLSIDSFSRIAADADLFVHDVSGCPPAEWARVLNLARNLRAQQLVFTNFQSDFPADPQGLMGDEDIDDPMFPNVLFAAAGDSFDVEYADSEDRMVYE